jgi:hypothetical protein
MEGDPVKLAKQDPLSAFANPTGAIDAHAAAMSASSISKFA